MEKILLFVVATLALAFISRNALFSPGKHGFYRFIAWECILGLFVLNMGGPVCNGRFPICGCRRCAADNFPAAGTFRTCAVVVVGEAENIAYFGDTYRQYMKRTWRFLPHVL